MQSVHIIANVVNSNPTNGEVYSIQDYVIKFVSHLRRSVVFSGYSGSSTNKTDHHDITDILLKIALNTNPQPYYMHVVFCFSFRTQNIIMVIF